MVGLERLERLEKAYGKLAIRLAEIECKGMRIEAQKNLCEARGIDAMHLSSLLSRIISARAEVHRSCMVTLGSIEDLRIEFGIVEAPEGWRPRAYPFQLGFQFE